MFRKIIYPFRIFSIVPFFLYLTTYGQENTNMIWSDIDEAIVLNKDREIIPQKYRTLLLDTEELKKVLAEAPLEFSKESETTEVILELPLPEGKFGLFRILESPVMETGLAVKYPGLKTYLGESLTKGIYNARFDFTPTGFHAMIRTKNGTVYIDPYSREDITTYISYYKRDYLPGESDKFVCKTEDVMTEEIRNQIVSKDYVVGEELRVYRLALAATGEYTIFHGGTVQAGMNAVVIVVNRVNMIFENDVAIRLVLVANNDILIYTDPENDPYTDNDEYEMMDENQSNLDAVIGNGNYDIGHVFGIQGGSVAQGWVVCQAGLKARGVTELSEPSGDPFYVDHVAHEIGHQFGASHSFNGNEAACNDAGISETAYEPGSGSTIMSYSGMCGTQNIQTNSDDYFHGISQGEIISYSTQGSGNSCPVIITTGNNAPVVTVPSGGFYVPKSTPFSLTGSAADPNGDEMTYCWEEFDLGPTGHPNFPSGNAPIFRSFKPEESSTRTFPKLSDIINNTQTIGEILPGYSRNLTFRLTARDNRAGGGGVGKSSNVTFSVANNAGPFTVTSPNTNVAWPGNTQQTITWNVANTNSSPVNCSQVNILLSVDGGLTFPITLLSNTPNDGSEYVLIPDNQTDAARIMVQAADNVFFDISNINFEIVKPVAVEFISFNYLVERNIVTLIWITGAELDNYGFGIERASIANNIMTQWESIGFIYHNITAGLSNHYSFIDSNLKPGSYLYRLKIIDTEGLFEYSYTLKIDINMPLKFNLAQNYPNPFNPVTVIQFELPEKELVFLKIFDVLGVEVVTLINEEREAGVHEVTFNASSYSGGVFFYTLRAGNFVKTNKMFLLK